RVVAQERVESGRLAAVKIERVRSPAQLSNAVPVLLAVGLFRIFGLRAVEPPALSVGVEHSAADQCLDPRGEIVGGRDDAPGSRGVGRILAGVVGGLESSGPGRGLEFGWVRLLR